MARGLPDSPPEEITFMESFDDTTCPSETCNFDIDDALQDPMAAHSQGILLAVEVADGSVFSSMSGAENEAWYWHCPECGTFFSTEAESLLGGMT